MFERNPDKSIDVTADGAVALVDDFATAGEQEEISTPPMSDKRGYVKSSARVGDAEPMAASDVAFLAPELVSEAEGPVPVPAPAEGRLGYRFVKRAFDIAFSLCATIAGLIPVALLCLAVRLESPGSPIYLQERVGYRGKPLRILKLRTMVADSDDVEKHLSPEQLTQWERERKVDDDPRVTRVGRFLRKTSLDELPQFLNVLAGQIPLRILKTRPEFSEKSMGAFALPAKSSTNKEEVFSQVVSCFASGLRMRRISKFNCNRIRGMEAQFLAKPVFGAVCA